MKKIFIIEPVGYSSPLLFETMVETFAENDVHFTKDINEADLVFFDCHSGLFDYDWKVIGEVVEGKLPVIFFDQFDYFTHERQWNENVENWHKLPSEKHWARAAKIFLSRDQIYVWFARKMCPPMKSSNITYPYEVIQYPDHIFEPTSKEELNERPIDICFIGNKATPRNNACAELSKHFKCDFVLGQERINHEDWLNRHRRSKLFLECGGGGESGGGFGSERLFQLCFISPCLHIKTEQIRETPFIDMEDVIEVGNGLGEITMEDIEKIKSVLKDENKLYEIYLCGIKKMQNNYSASYRANYILQTLKKENLL